MTRPTPPQDRLDDEIQFHIDQQIEKNLRAGMSAADAKRDAMRRFGGVERAREDARDEMRFAWFADFVRDLTISLRSLRRLPSFAAATILTFGLGLGAAAAMFTVVNGVLLKPLPYPQADRIVQLYQLGETGVRNRVSGPNFEDWKAGTHSFGALSILANYGRAPVTGLGDPRMVSVMRVASRFFDIMRVQPAAGRLFAADEYVDARPTVAVIGATLAERMAPGGPAGWAREVVGQRLTYDGASLTIVGVMPDGFDYPAGTDLWLPLDEAAAIATSRTSHNYQAIGRLADGVSLASARSELSSVSRGVKARYGDDTWMFDGDVAPILDVMTGKSKTSLEVLLAASLLLLAVATANVSNMLVARGASRQKEFAVQLALGASRGRITRQLLAETFALCLCGALLGLAVAAGAVRAFVALGPDSAPRLGQLSLDGSSVTFAIGAAAVISAVLALVTAFSTKTTAISGALTEETRGGSSGRRQMRMRESLIVLEVALTLVLLAGGGLLARSLASVLAIDPGFSTDNALIADLTMTSEGEGGVARRVSDQAEIVARLSALPGVQHVGFINGFPIGEGFFANGRFVEMTSADEFTTYDQIQQLGASLKPRFGSATYRLASGGYFTAMGIPLVRGRLLDDADREGAPQVAVISASLANEKWPGQDPIGRYVQFGNMDGDMRGIRIVGIVGDVREVTIEQAPPSILYVSYLQRPQKGESFSLVIRGPKPEAIAATVRQVIHEMSPMTPIELRTVTGALDVATGSRRFNFWLIGAFAVCALVLAALGVYGLVSFMVVQRTREMGIRMALGAQPGGIVRLLVTRGIVLSLVGAALGLVAAMSLTGVVNNLLFGVTAADPLVYVVVVTTMVLVASAASYLPARRVLNQTPARTLRDI
jgi:predicted permease